MPARYVKPYVQRGKSDALDAAAICEAVSRPTMRFAAIKSVEQQSALTLHRAREILVKQETMLANLIRGCLGEFGIVAPLGIRRIAELVGIIRDKTDSRIPPHARIAMTAVADQLGDLQRRIKEIEQAIRAWHRNNDVSRQLATIPGVGIITASAIAATIATPTEFKSARHFAAFLGLTPEQHSTGGRQRLGRISKQGNGYIRRLLILGETALVRYAQRRRYGLGQATAGTSASTRRHRCPRQQGGTHHLGVACPRRRSLIAARPSRPECCPARVMVLSAVSRAAATSGPVRKCGHCKVHNGLTRDRVPTAPTAQLSVPSPGGDTLVLNAWGRDLGALCWHRLRGPAERLPGSPHAVQEDRQLARQGDARLARTGALLDGFGPGLQV